MASARDRGCFVLHRARQLRAAIVLRRMLYAAVLYARGKKCFRSRPAPGHKNRTSVAVEGAAHPTIHPPATDVSDRFRRTSKMMHRLQGNADSFPRIGWAT